MSRSVSAAVFSTHSGDDCVIQDVVLDEPGPKELVVKVRACGICHTDISAAGIFPRPLVLGHETAGDIVQVGSEVTEFSVGDRVVATFAACGLCESCLDDAPAYCWSHNDLNFSGHRPNGASSLRDMENKPIFSAFFQQSGFASHIIAQQTNLVKIPDELSYERAAPLGCGIQTGAGAVLNSLNANPGQSIAIFGTGAVGLSAILAARYRRCAQIIAVDIEADRLETARQFGATHTILGSEHDVENRIREITGGGAHFALDTTGALQPFQAAINCLRRRGTCGALTFPGPYGEPVLHPGGDALMSTRLIGIIEGDSDPCEFIPQLINLHLSGDLPFEPMITAFAYEEINVALDAMRNKQVIKPVLLFED